MRQKLILILLPILLFLNCAYFTSHGRAYKQADKAYQLGDYDSAVESCIASLQAKRDYDKSLTLMNEIFPIAVKSHIRAIDRLPSSGNDFYNDKIVQHFTDLIHLVEIVENLNHPKTEVWFFKANVQDYSDALNEAKLNASEAHYKVGKTYLSSEKVEDFRKAAYEFKLALSFNTPYKDAHELYADARKLGTLQIAVLTFENKSGKNKFGAVGETLSNKLISHLMNDSQLMEFTNFVNRDQIDLIIEELKLGQSGLVHDESIVDVGNLKNVDRLISGAISQIIISPPNHKKERKTLTKNVKTGSEVFTDSLGQQQTVDIYSDVKAHVVYHNIIASVTVTANVKVVDVETSSLFFNKNITRTIDYSHKWATYRGDSRALDWSTQILSNRKEKSPPPSETLLTQALNEISIEMKEILIVKF
jgi:hypothetical protein